MSEEQDDGGTPSGETEVAGSSVDDLRDEDLVAQAATDPDAFAVLYERHLTGVFRYVRRHVPTTQHAEDVVSEVFVAALSGLREFRRRPQTFRAWIFGIARHKVADLYRSRTMIEYLQVDIADGTDLEGETILLEELSALRGLLLELSAKEREILLLHHRDGLSWKEVGQVIGKREGAVRVVAHRTIKKIRTRWSQAGQP